MKKGKHKKASSEPVESFDDELRDTVARLRGDKNQTLQLYGVGNQFGGFVGPRSTNLVVELLNDDGLPLYVRLSSVTAFVVAPRLSLVPE